MAKPVTCFNVASCGVVCVSKNYLVRRCSAVFDNEDKCGYSENNPFPQHLGACSSPRYFYTLAKAHIKQNSDHHTSLKHVYNSSRAAL
jgi:hypothetical protein